MEDMEDSELYYHKVKTRGLLIMGNPGVGKTCGIKLIIESLGMRMKVITDEDLRSRRDNNTRLSEFQ